jgi:hypothetical protein
MKSRRRIASLKTADFALQQGFATENMNFFTPMSSPC